MARSTTLIDKGACVGADPELFFPSQGGGGAFKMQRAKKICAGCPVMDDCLELAIDNWPSFGWGQYGVWGGTTPEERQRIVDNLEVAA